MIDLVLAARPRAIGPFTVDRVLPAPQRRHVGPYIFLDHLGPEPPGPGFGVAAHPHIGLATLTYLYEGELVHHDSLGNTLPIRPGEVNWMTAGRGISHSERPSPGGGGLHSLQLWVGLTAEYEEVEPDFQHLGRDELPVVAAGEAAARLIAGTAYGATSPLRIYSEQFCVDLRLARGASAPLPAGHAERAAYVVAGSVRVDGVVHPARRLLVFAPGGAPTLTAESDAVVLLLGGAPISPPRMWWNFVSTRQDRIEQAKRDWAEGRIPLPPDDDSEFIPLPPAPKTPEPMS